MRKLGLVSVGLLLVACGGASNVAGAPSAPSGLARESGGAAGYAPSTPSAPPPVTAGPTSLPPSESAASGARTAAKEDASSRGDSSATPAARAESAPPSSHGRGGWLTAGVWDDAKNFDFFQGYATKLRARGADFDVFANGELSAAHARAQQANAKPKRELDVQIVFDTTGSMGDELSYVQGEIDSIAARLRERLPEVRPRWSLVFYRDKGDEYVTRPFAFSTDTAMIRGALNAQSAGGGGDYPEAVVAGLTTAADMPWREQADVAKVAFWIADAPSHSGEGKAFGDVVRRIAKKGVHLYPIAASGADELTELEMRSAALITGGRYMFLTDDSGVGGAHAEPHIPCYAVTKLDAAIVRMLEIEVKGEHLSPSANEVLRAVGEPRPDGACKLGSGDLVAAY